MGGSGGRSWGFGLVGCLRSRALAISEELVQVSTRGLPRTPQLGPTWCTDCRGCLPGRNSESFWKQPSPSAFQCLKARWPVSCTGTIPVSFFPRAKVIPAPRCRPSDLTCWPCSLTSPAGPHCTSVSTSCWARTGSRGEHPLPAPLPGRPGGMTAAPRGPLGIWPSVPPTGTLEGGSCSGCHNPGDTEPTWSRCACSG